MATYEQITSFPLGDWAEWIVERATSRYELVRNVRLTGSSCPRWRISKAEALGLTSIRACEQLAASREPIRPVKVCAVYATIRIREEVTMLKTTAEVAAELGVPFRTLHGWQERGVLTPAHGRTTRAAFGWSEKDRREARTVKGLRDCGLPLQSIRKTQAYLRELGFNPFSKGDVCVILGKKGRPEDIIKVVDKETAFALLRERGQLVMLSLADLGVEREAYDNTPESLQGTDRGMQMEAAADALDEACSAIETALE